MMLSNGATLAEVAHQLGHAPGLTNDPPLRRVHSSSPSEYRQQGSGSDECFTRVKKVQKYLRQKQSYGISTEQLFYDGPLDEEFRGNFG